MPAPGLDLFFSQPLPPAVVAQVLSLAQTDATQPAADQPAGDQRVAPAVEGEGGSPGTLAPGTAPGPASPAKPRPEGIFGFISNAGPLIPLAVVMVFFYVFIISGNRKKDKARKETINNLVRGDRVTTIGGIIGSVVDATGDEVTIKIDENNNTKLKITRSAVANVVKPGAEKVG